MAFSADIEDSGLDLTPLLDVVFNLLVFFLLGASFATQEASLDVKLPKVPEATPLVPPPEPMTINVTAAGRIVIEDAAYSRDQLLLKMRQIQKSFPDQAVAIRGDANARYEDVALVISICEQAGIRKYNILVNEE